MEKFVRWQSVAREQLTAVANLILALSTGMIAFEANFLAENAGSVSASAARYFVFSLCTFLFSVGCGVLCAVNRLQDFRLTAQIAANNELASGKRWLAKLRGKITWWLLWLQLLSFVIAMGLAVFFFLDHYSSILGLF